MPDMEWVVQLITALAYLVSAVRLASYHRGGAHFRRAISLLASLLGASLCLSALEILLYWTPVSLWHATTAVLLCVLIIRSRGNVAALLRPNP
ncbi:phage holin family protein [Pseudomonas sp. NPDC098747]|uniref:phage holin family protein n=1 Tax=Pseudomonas sp. NPDC098747 TaxID=3364487 RepID=UPI00383B2084